MKKVNERVTPYGEEGESPRGLAFTASFSPGDAATFSPPFPPFSSPTKTSRKGTTARVSALRNYLTERNRSRDIATRLPLFFNRRPSRYVDAWRRLVVARAACTRGCKRFYERGKRTRLVCLESGVLLSLSLSCEGRHGARLHEGTSLGEVLLVPLFPFLNVTSFNGRRNCCE